jgi:hypothetical protein
VRVAQIVGPEGVVNVLDVQPSMLDATRQWAQRHRLHNVVTSIADASGRFPYPDATFDAAPDEPQQTLAGEEFSSPVDRRVTRLAGHLLIRRVV